MVDKISGSPPIGLYRQSGKPNVPKDIHNISPNEMDAITLTLFKNGEISLKERLPFVPLETNQLNTHSGQKISIGYYSKVWDNPDKKRDMKVEFEKILQEQITRNESMENITFTRNALALLDRIEQNTSFAALFEDNLDKV